MANKKVIMVSGANRGIGLKVAQTLVAQGYSVSLGMRNLKDISGIDSKDHLLFEYDAMRRETAGNWVEATVKRYGRLDGLVNVAGILNVVPLEGGPENDDADEAALDALWQGNVKGPWWLIRRAMPHLKQAKTGRIVTVVSMSGKRVKGVSAGYAVSKFAQMALHHAARNVGWDDGVRSVAICPGWVKTDMITEVCKLPDDQIIQPQTIADLVVMALQLPNQASIGELTVQCELEM